MSFREDIKFKPEEKYRKILEKINNKYNYDEKTYSLLQILIPELIQYYGSEYEEHIINALENNQIIRVNSPKLVGENIRQLKETAQNSGTIYTLDSDSEVEQVASGVYDSVVVLKENENKEIEIAERKGIIVYNEGTPIIEIAVLAHELSHAIKSSKNEYTIENVNGRNKLNVRSGLIQEVYDISQTENGQFILKKETRENVGIEEGINSLDEENIVNNILQGKNVDISLLTENAKKYLEHLQQEKSYSSDGYRIQRAVAQRFIEKIGKKIIASAQIGNSIDMNKYYNEKFTDSKNHWKEFNELVDESVRLTYDKFKNIFVLRQWLEKNGEKEKKCIGQIKEELNALDEAKSKEDELHLH